MSMDDLSKIIAFAIEREKDAVAFYTDLTEKARFAPQRELLLELADMERGHIRVLQTLEKKGFTKLTPKKPMNLRLGDYMVPWEKPLAELDYQGILLLAIKREETSYRLYTNLAEETDSEEEKVLFTRIAGEEAEHKLKFETLYDEDILKDN